MLYFQIPLNMLPYETKTFLNGKTEPVVLKSKACFTIGKILLWNLMFSLQGPRVSQTVTLGRQKAFKYNLKEGENNFKP